MFEQINEVTIKGGYFENAVPLKLFGKRFNVLYGRNGSGKTSISRALAEFKMPDEEIEGERKFTVTFNPVLGNEEKKRIFVFNEDYVNKNVRLDENADGLGTIVMLGDAADIQGQIDVKTAELTGINAALLPLETAYNRYTSETDEISPNKLFNDLKNALSEWARIDSEIKGHRKNTSLGDGVVTDIKDSAGEFDPSLDIAKLQRDFNSALNVFLAASQGERITWSCSLMTQPDSLENFRSLLNQKIEKPEPSERDRVIVELMTSVMDAHYVNEARERFGKEETTYCPMCMRSISLEEKEDLVQRINRLMTDRVNEYQRQLAEMRHKFEDVAIDLTPIGTMFRAEKAAVISAMAPLNNFLLGIRTLIDNKSYNLYGVVQYGYDEAMLMERITAYNTALNALKNKVDEYNRSIDEKEAKKAELILQNKKVAYYSHKAAFDVYYTAKAESEANKEEYEAKKTAKEACEQAIRDLEQAKKFVNIAQDIINKYLSYVFYDDERMKLVSGDNMYALHVNGQPISPCKVSTGERNILGLCYFLASMFEGKKKGHEFDDELLMIVDDPISSFDFENKVGVASLIRMVSCNVLEKNPYSKILIMSHDLQTIFNLQKVKAELRIANPDQVDELAEKSIKTITQRKRNEYKKLLDNIFSFANGDVDGKDISIGNQMRKVMEAYATFVYRKRMEDAFHNEDVLDSIPNEKKTYYKNFMFRLILNGESHEEEAVYTLSNFDDLYTIGEKRRTARCVLLLLYYINKPHLAAYIDDPAQFATIESWKDSGLEEV
jgi:energy-coupling factor transporter ATP-binding protein EcfA2